MRYDHQEVVRLLSSKGARLWDEGKLVPLEASRLRGLVNMRVSALIDSGFDPEWEVNPRELQLLERIGGWVVQGAGVADCDGEDKRVVG